MAIQTNHSSESLKPDSGVLTVDATGALALPAGTEVERPLGAAAGHIRFDQTSTKPEYFNGSIWDKLTSKSYVDAADQNLQDQINNIISNIDPVALDSLTEIVQAFQASDGSLTDALAALTQTLNANLAQEIADRIAGDQTLADSISNLTQTVNDDLAQEIANRQEEDSNIIDTIETVTESLQDADQQEEAARIAGDQDLQDQLDAESLARTTADTTLQSNLDAESLARTTADANLQAQIDSILSNLDPAALDSLTEIVEAFQNADTGLLASINTLIANTTADLNQERIERIAADAAETAARITDDAINAAAINTERDRALAAEEVLQGNIDTEALTRSTADNTLQDNIDAEVLRATTAEQDLQDQIDAEVLRATTAEQTLETTLQANIDAEETARIAGDQDLQGQLDAEVLRATTAEQNIQTTLQSGLDAEIATRTAEDAYLQDQIDAETLRATETEQELRDDLTAETLRATAAEQALETSLQANIDAEELARIAGDATLQANLDAEAILRSDADTLLQSNINLEVLARIAGDATLQANLDAEAVARDAGDQQVTDYVDQQISNTIGTINSLELNDLTDVTINSGPTEGQSLVFDSTLGQFRPATNALAPITRSFIGDGSTLEFDIIDSVPSPNNLVVVVNGIAQQPFYSYTVIDGTRLTFDEAPEANDIIEVRVLKGSATSDRPRPVISNISYSTMGSYNVVTFNATDITYGTGAKIDGISIARIDYPTPNTMQLMFEHGFSSDQYDLTLVDTSGNEYLYPGAIKFGSGAPQWTDTVQFVGSFSGGDTINFAVGVNNASTLTLGAVAPGDTALSWLSVSGMNIVGTAPVNSSPTRYELKVIATSGSVDITRHYWLVVV